MLLHDVILQSPRHQAVASRRATYTKFPTDPLKGDAWPGDVLGHSDGILHAAGLTENSALTSWTTDRSVAEDFAGGATGRGVILSTTLEEQAHRVVPGPDALGESEVLLRGVVFDSRVEMFGW